MKWILIYWLCVWDNGRIVPSATSTAEFLTQRKCLYALSEIKRKARRPDRVTGICTPK